MLTRREWIAVAVASGAGSLARRGGWSGSSGPTLTARRNPGCGCCLEWVNHLESLGFTVIMTEDPALDAYKRSLGVPSELKSCHTGVVQGYVIEGHVPGDVILRMLKEKPAIAGLGVPGMPAGSPGMDAPNGVPFDVVAFTKSGDRKVYQRWTPKSG